MINAPILSTKENTAHHSFLIDVAGTCNLRCPSCPVGSFEKTMRPKGFMDPQLFNDIVEKIKSLYGVNTKLFLYNWGEPTLNPKLPEILKIAHDAELPVEISSNLNIPNQFDLEKILEYPPFSIAVSTSGFRKESYNRTHVKGNLAKFMKNFWYLSEINSRMKPPIKVKVYYHVYKHNINELKFAREICRLAGFTFEPVLAFYMPMEKILSNTFSEKDIDVIEQMYMNPENAFKLAEQLKQIHKYDDCKLRRSQTVINFDGSVAQCCSTYEADNIFESFLDKELDKVSLKEKKYQNPICKTCMSKNGHIYAEDSFRRNSHITLQHIYFRHNEYGPSEVPPSAS